jgi:hypothetical protein
LWELGIFKVPIKEWKEKLSSYMNDVRRYNGIGLEDRILDAKAAGYVRKMVNLSGRDLTEADFENEYKNTNPITGAKVWPNKRGLSASKWKKILFETIEEVVGNIFPQIMRNAELRSIEEWWKSRRAWIPNGSSSARERLRDFKKLDERLKTKDRPGKRAVGETYSSEDIHSWLKMRPTAIARLSTKPEPGFKRRALYASDDGSTFIASYASADIEKALSMYDMVIKQSPEDIMKWLSANAKARENPLAIWVSLDYSDFNKEHSKLAMHYLNLIIAKNWLRRARISTMQDILLQKAYCALWIANSHYNSWHCEDDERMIRHWSGLWSGHRDTARDNTILHTVYSEAMKRLAKEYCGVNVKTYYHGKCGDDEDGLYTNWIAAAVFTGAHRVCGFALNPIKQLVGTWEHEFLQRTCNREMLPIKPLPAIIATLSTGNWYKQPADYYGSAIASMTGVLSELIVRGCNRSLAVNTCLKIAKKMMRVKKTRVVEVFGGKTNGRSDVQEVKWIKLEMDLFYYELIRKEDWKTSTDEDGTTILEGPWQGLRIPRRKGMSGMEIELSKLDELDVELRSEEMPSKATDDWISLQERWLESNIVETYKNQLLKTAYTSMFGDFSQRERLKKASVKIPLRKTHLIIDENVVVKYNPMAEEIMDEIQKGYNYTKPITDDALIAKMHMDRSLFNLLGGWPGIFAKGKNKDIKHYQVVREPRLAYREKELAKRCLDGVIRSWIVNRRLEQ